MRTRVKPVLWRKSDICVRSISQISLKLSDLTCLSSVQLFRDAEDNYTEVTNLITPTLAQ